MTTTVHATAGSPPEVAASKVEPENALPFFFHSRETFAPSVTLAVVAAINTLLAEYEDDVDEAVATAKLAKLSQ